MEPDPGLNTTEGRGGQSDWPYREIIAIAGGQLDVIASLHSLHLIPGVLGFWGGVWCLGIVFLASLMVQRSSCRKGDERKKVSYHCSLRCDRHCYRGYDPAPASSPVSNTVYVTLVR